MLVRARGVDICVETFGAPGVAVLLISGGAASMEYWEDEFCARLAAGGRYVIRYDLRDTGRSTTCPPGAPDYTGDDLVLDAVAVLDALGVATAHVVGISLGGMLAQRLGVEHPERVATLCLLSTSPAGPGSAENGLPPMHPDLVASFGAPEPDWSDRESVIASTLASLRAYAGTIPVDEERARAIVGRAFDRSIGIASAGNHFLADGGGSEPLRPRLGTITAPTLVLHGTADPFFPYGHGEALAAEIPGARLVALPGVGHEYPPVPVWDLVLDELLRHTAAVAAR